MRVYSVFVLFSLLFISLTGCAKQDRFGFDGTVTLNGVPIEKGTISLTPTSGDPSSFCMTGVESGKCTFPSDGGLKPGTYRVEISSIDMDKSDLTKSPPKIVDLIPSDWNQESEHTVEISSGKNIFTFDVTK